MTKGQTIKKDGIGTITMRDERRYMVNLDNGITAGPFKTLPDAIAYAEEGAQL